MAPPRVVVAHNDLGIFNDPAYTVAAGSHRVADVELAANHPSSPLRTISSTNTPNPRSKPVSRVESLTAQLEKLHIGDSQQATPCKGKAQAGARVTRPSVTANTFVPLETVAEDEQTEQTEAPKLDLAAVPTGHPQYIELPVDRWAQHPLALAARVSPPAAEQFEKQRNGHFDWVLTVKPQAASESGEEKRLFFGCNLLPVLRYSDKDASSKEEELRSYTLLATPLEGDEEPVIDAPAAQETSMALAEAPRERPTPAKTGTKPLPAVRVEEYSSAVAGVRDGEDGYVPAVVSKMPAKEVEGIEAIDQFEEDMEAFELAAGFKTTTSPSIGVNDIRSPKMPAPPLAPVPRRDRTQAPQRERPSPSASASKTRSDRRPSPLILLDSPKPKGEDKALAQASPRKTPSKALASLQPLKPSVRSTKAPTVPAFDLPGEAVAHRLEELREARRASQGTSSQVVQDGGCKVGHRLGEKQEDRVPTQFAQTRPYRPQVYSAAAWTASATDGASSERDDDSNDESISESTTEWERIMEHANARFIPRTVTGRCEKAECHKRLAEKERADNKRSAERENNHDKRSTENETDHDSNRLAEVDSDDESISESVMAVIMDHANGHLTPPTVSGRREKAGRLRRLAEKERDDDKRSTENETDHDSNRLAEEDSDDESISESISESVMAVIMEHANGHLTPPTVSGRREKAERLKRLAEKERNDNERSTEQDSDDEEDSDGESISESVMAVIMEHANGHLTPPTVSGRREKAERLKRLAEKESDENSKRSTEKDTDDGSMEVDTAHHNARLTTPARTGEHEGAERLKCSSSPRRAKSTKASTLPRFELPGEAISRRKREEHEARRKAQEEEERRRRQFKARPVRSTPAPSTVPRGTIASRARVNDTLFEKPAQQASPTPNKRASMVMGTQQASPTPNKRASMVMDTQPRGRHLTTSKADQAGPHASRMASSSVGSTGKRSSVSLEEVQQQRVRGKDIFQRDSAFSQDRTKERREREIMARTAREEAAERSRQQSREWAEKQKRKRMTISSLREVTKPRIM